MSIFKRALQQRGEPQRSLWTRLIGTPNTGGFTTEVGNRLRALQAGQTFNAADAAVIRSKFKLTKSSQGRAEALRLIGKVTTKLTASDIQQQTGDAIRSVAKALDLPSGKVEELLARAGERAFREAIDAALSDDTLTQQEHNDLTNLATAAGLRDDQATSILTAAVSKRLEEEANSALSDGELSPEEERTISQLATRLHTKLSFSEQTERAMEEARRLWRINHGPLTPIESPLLLRKGENAYAVYDAEALETRTRTTSYRYGGPSVRVKIMKGVSYRVGSASVSRTTEEYSHSFGRGTVVMTDRRLLFRAAEKTLNLNYPKIVDFELFRDGVKIYKETGKPLTIAIDRHDQAFGLLFARLVSG